MHPCASLHYASGNYVLQISKTGASEMEECQCASASSSSGGSCVEVWVQPTLIVMQTSYLGRFALGMMSASTRVHRKFIVVVSWHKEIPGTWHSPLRGVE